MDYEVGRNLEIINQKLDYLISKLAPPKKAEGKKAPEEEY